jgi:hypothetical protein
MPGSTLFLFSWKVVFFIFMIVKPSTFLTKAIYSENIFIIIISPVKKNMSIQAPMKSSKMKFLSSKFNEKA